MPTILVFAQAETPEIESPLAKVFWFGIFPLLILTLIFGGGWYLRRVGRLQREKERKNQADDDRSSAIE